MLKIVIPTLVIGTLIVASHWYLKADTDYQSLSFNMNDAEKVEKINNFSDCVEAGNPIMESYPEQCRTADGRVFINLPMDNSTTAPETNQKRAPITNEDWSDEDKLSAMSNVRLQASKDLGLPEAIFEVVSVSEEIWPDGCLGLATADEMCIMMQIPGYKITLKANNETVVYRTDKTGSVVKKDTQLETQ